MENEKCEHCPARKVCFHIDPTIQTGPDECIGLYYYKSGFDTAKNQKSPPEKKDTKNNEKEIENWVKLKAWGNDSDIINMLTHVGYNRALIDVQDILKELFYEARNIYDNVDDVLFYINYRLPEIFRLKKKDL